MVIWAPGLNGQGLGPYGLGRLIARFSAMAIFLTIPSYLPLPNGFSEPLASLGSGLELRAWWRDACLPNEIERVWLSSKDMMKPLAT